MTFIERQLRILAAAIFGLIAVRIFLLPEAAAFNLDGFQNGFLQYRIWFGSDPEDRDLSDHNLANMISNAIRKQRSGIVIPPHDGEIITGSTTAPSEPKSTPRNDEPSASPSSSKEEKKAQVPGVTDVKGEKPVSDVASPLAAPVDAAKPGDAERTVLERLGLRRSELDKREEDLANREALLQAAEKRLAERSDELKKLELDLKARSEERNAELMSLKPIVTIYETMKPKEAARVFEKLEFANLLMVSAAMNPRKLSDVLAQMDPALAGKLTKAMSSQNRAAVLPATRVSAEPNNELPDLNPQGTP